MGFSENTRGANGSGNNVIWAILLLCAGVVLMLALQQGRADRAHPQPSPSMSKASAETGGTLLGEERWSWGIGLRP